jgi:RecA/RadA recombinase
MRAGDEGATCRAAAAAAVTAAAATTSGCKLYAWAEFSFFVEDVKSRQADIENLLLSEKNSRSGVTVPLLRVRC